MTSGASLLARAAVIFWPIPSHSWIWIFTSIVGWRLSKSAVNSFWNWAETLSRISHTSTVVRPSPFPESGPDDGLQALSAAVRTSTDPPASKRYFTVHLGSRMDRTDLTRPDHLSSEAHWTACLSVVDEGGIDQ